MTINSKMKNWDLLEKCQKYVLLLFFRPILRNPKRVCRETCCLTHHQENTPTTKLRLQFSTTILNYATSIMFLQTWSLVNLVRCSTFLRIMKRWSKWSSRAEVQQWDMYPETTGLRLIGCSIESTWTQQSTSNMLTPKTQLADILTKGNFTRDEWNHLLHLFNISIFSSASCPDAMSTRMQRGNREERIVAKSKPTLNLVSHIAASSPAAPSSSASNRPGILRAPSQQGSNVTAQRCRETCRWRFKSEWRSVDFSSVADRRKDERTCDETRCWRNEPGSEFTRMCMETCRRKIRNQRRGRFEVVAQLPHFTC